MIFHAHGDCNTWEIAPKPSCGGHCVFIAWGQLEKVELHLVQSSSDHDASILFDNMEDHRS